MLSQCPDGVMVTVLSPAVPSVSIIRLDWFENDGEPYAAD